MEVSHSKLATFRRCPLRYQIFYESDQLPEEIRLVQKRPSEAQMIGTVLHKSLPGIYLAKRSLTEIIEQAIVDLTEDDSERVSLFEKCYPIAEAYAEQAIVDEWEVVDVEREFRVSVLYGGQEFQLHGFVDLIIRKANQYWMVENKFVKIVPTVANNLPQVGIYLTVKDHIGFPHEISGLIFNCVVKNPFKIIRTHITRVNSDLLLREIAEQINLMREIHNRNLMPYRNFVTDCQYDCEAFAICKLYEEKPWN